MSTCSRTALALLLVTGGLAPLVTAGWEPAPPLNLPRHFFAAAVTPAGDFVVCGGWDRTSGCATAEGPVWQCVELLRWDGQAYAPEWEILPTGMPSPRWLHCAAVSGRFLYVFGGFSELHPPLDSAPLARVDRYDLLDGTWSTDAVPAPSIARFDCGVAVDSYGRIWLIGGQSRASSDPASFVAEVEIFDPLRPELGWQPGPSLTQARARCGVTVDRAGQIWVIGGFNDYQGPGLRTVERIDPCHEMAWQLATDSLPEPWSVTAPAAVGADGRVYVVGRDAFGSAYSDEVVRIHPECPGAGWSSYDSLATERAFPLVLLGRDACIYAIGGESWGCESIASVERLYTGAAPGDLNQDGLVDFGDINPFVLLLTSGCW